MSEKEKKGKKAMPVKKAPTETVPRELAQEMPQDMPEHTVELMQSEDAAEIFAGALPEEARQLAGRLAQENENLFQQHLRLQADFDNFRKRSRQEREDMVKLAATALMQDLLPVLDNFERALNALAESSEREGVRLIHRQFMEVLIGAGLSPIEAMGADFDPQLHDAILQTEAGPEQKGKVIGEAQKGYLLHGKLLRPSRVQVGS